MSDKTASEKKAEAIKEMIAEQSKVKVESAPTTKEKKAKADKPK